MAADGEDVTLGEVYRIVLRIDSELQHMVSAPTLEAELRIRDQQIGTLQADVKALVSERDKWRMAIFMTILVPILMRVLEMNA